MATAKKRLFVGIAMGLVTLAICLYVVIQIPKPAAAYSTAASILSAIQTLGVTNVAISLKTNTSRVLDGADYSSLMSLISKSELIDSSRRDALAGQILDPWKAPFMIEVQKSDSGALRCIVWSKGRDGISGTSDDVVAPYGSRVPRDLK